VLEDWLVEHFDNPCEPHPPTLYSPTQPPQPLPRSGSQSPPFCRPRPFLLCGE
jgi:hypothetical protein